MRKGGLDRTRIVGALKLVLPLSALALLSMVFLTAAPVDPTRALETATIDVEDRVRDPRLSGARFAGVTDEGAALTIEAGIARSDAQAALRFQLDDLEIRLTAPDGATFVARADTGRLDRAAGRFEMAGDIRLQASPGYDLTATRIEGLLDRTRIEAEGPVAGQAPGGRLQAGHLSLTARPGDPASNRLVFRQGVRLIYRTDP